MSNVSTTKKEHNSQLRCCNCKNYLRESVSEIDKKISLIIPRFTKNINICCLCLLCSVGCSPSPPLARSSEGGIWVPHLPVPDATARGWDAVWRIHEPAWEPYDPGLFSWT